MSDTPKSICLFIGTLKAGGAERVIVWLANYLAGCGFEVTLVTLSGEEDDFFQLDPLVRRVALSLQGRNHIISKPLANIKRVRALRRVLREFHVVRLIAFMPHESVLGILASKGTSCRVIVSERTAPWRRDPGKIWKFLRRLLYRFADCHVAQTNATAEWLKTQIGARNVDVIPNPVKFPLPIASPLVIPDTYLSEGRFCVLGLGGRPHLKGFDLLAKAFLRVASDHPKWDLALPGLASDFKENSFANSDLQAIIRSDQLAGRVHLPGRVGNASDWYNAAEIFVLSSRVEGFPNVLVEAMSHGCAVAAFDCETGPRDILTDEHDGLLVRDGDVDALASALDRLMSDAKLRARLGTAARNVTKRYCEDRIAAKWLEVLR